MEPQIILEDWSPVCNIQAFVEKSDRAYYFYLWINPGSEDAEIRTCWICNRMEAPKKVVPSEFSDGQAPRMPAEFVGHDKYGIDLDEETLDIVWFEEGDAAALLSGDKILAVIPCFSGYKDFHGYSIYAEGTGPYAWEMKQAYENFLKKITICKKTWDYFETEYWPEVQSSHLNSLNNFWEKQQRYYAIDGGEFPPKALITGQKDDILYAITAGVSIIPMPKVEMNYQDEYTDYRRIELGFACIESKVQIMQKMLPSISGLSNLPWEEITFLGHGHTIPIDPINDYKYILFLNSNELNIEAPKYEKFRGDRINLLWLKLIDEDEYNYVYENGVAAYLDIHKEHDIHILM